MKHNIFKLCCTRVNIAEGNLKNTPWSSIIDTCLDRSDGQITQILKNLLPKDKDYQDYTILIPQDAAFGDLSKERLTDNFTNESPKHLRKTISNHILKGSIDLSGHSTQGTIEVLNTQTITGRAVSIRAQENGKYTISIEGNGVHSISNVSKLAEQDNIVAISTDTLFV